MALAEHTSNDHTAENIAILCRLILNFLRADLAKSSIHTKIKREAWDDTFLLSLIAQIISLIAQINSPAASGRL